MTPMIVAHRGSSKVFPEHSQAAYERAIAEGADALECDVRLTRDGHLVLMHDATIERTSNGTGAISTMTLNQLRKFRYPDPHEIMTLNQLLEMSSAADRPVGLSIETKHPSRDSHRLEDAVCSVLAKYGRDSEDSGVRIMSFSRAGLQRARKCNPRLPLVYLFDEPPAAWRNGGLPAGVQIAGPSVAYLRRDPDYVARVHSRGGDVHVWTVDEADDISLCTQLEVDAIITNRPAYVRETLTGG
jgi:glycerophosphoryl diester phosphodiesterase